MIIVSMHDWYLPTIYLRAVHHIFYVNAQRCSEHTKSLMQLNEEAVEEEEAVRRR